MNIINNILGKGLSYDRHSHDATTMSSSASDKLSAINAAYYKSKGMTKTPNAQGGTSWTKPKETTQTTSVTVAPAGGNRTINQPTMAVTKTPIPGTTKSSGSPSSGSSPLMANASTIPAALPQSMTNAGFGVNPITNTQNVYGIAQTSQAKPLPQSSLSNNTLSAGWGLTPVTTIMDVVTKTPTYTKAVINPKTGNPMIVSNVPTINPSTLLGTSLGVSTGKENIIETIMTPMPASRGGRTDGPTIAAAGRLAEPFIEKTSEPVVKNIYYNVRGLPSQYQEQAVIPELKASRYFAQQNFQTMGQPGMSGGRMGPRLMRPGFVKANKLKDFAGEFFSRKWSGL
jgi:hypothetical protein